MENNKSSVDPIYEKLRKTAGFELSIQTCHNLMKLTTYRKELSQEALRSGYSAIHKEAYEYVENRIKELLAL